MNKPAGGVSVQLVSVATKPVPVTVTSVAGAVGGPVIGGDPLVGLSVTAGSTVNVVVAESPWLPITVTEYTPLGALAETIKPDKKRMPAGKN
jgi:hypothetical protein